MIFKIFSSKNKFPQPPKSTKKYSSKYNNSKYSGYRSVINITQNSGKSTIKTLIYTLDKYFLPTRIKSFFDPEKSLKEVDSCSTCTFYECQY